MPESIVSNIIKTLLFKKNLKATQLAREINLPQQTVQRIVSGTSSNPHSKTLKPIANFFDISIKQLKGELPLPEIFATTSVSTEQPKIKHIPLINWEDLNNYLADKDVYQPSEYIYVDRTASDETFALRMQDSSMAPYFPKNSILILCQEKQIKDRCFCLVRVNESNTFIFRQVIIDGEYKYLKPMNPDLNLFQMRILKEEDEILAALIEFRHKYEET